MTLTRNLAVSLSCNPVNFSMLARVPTNLFMNLLYSRNRGPYWVRAKDRFHPTISPPIISTGLLE